MRKILVTGGSGFLGKHLKKLIDERKNRFKLFHGDKVFFFPSRSEVDCLYEQDLIDYISENKINIIVHMAAICGGIGLNKRKPADLLRDNTRMALNIYEASRICRVTKVYSLGSVCMYPKYCPVPFNEDNIWNGAAEETNFPYGQAKRTLMMLSQTYRQQYGIGGAHLIPVNLYGEYDHFDLENSHVIPALINKFTTAVSQGDRNVTCWGTGSATREFLYAGDAAEAIIKAVFIGLDIDLPINLGTGVDISIKELALLIGKLTGFEGEIEFTGQVSDGQPKRCLDVSRARNILGWEAHTKLYDGLVKTISWYINKTGKLNEEKSKS